MKTSLLRLLSGFNGRTSDVISISNAEPKAFVYEKLRDAGQKPGNAGKSKRRIRLPEPTMFSDRVSRDSPDLPSESMVTPIKARKIRETEDWEVKYFFHIA